MLKISPFSYGLVISNVYYSGSVFNPEILDITDADLLVKFKAGVVNVTAISLAISTWPRRNISFLRFRCLTYCRCAGMYLQNNKQK